MRPLCLIVCPVLAAAAAGDPASWTTLVGQIMRNPADQARWHLVVAGPFDPLAWRRQDLYQKLQASRQVRVHAIGQDVFTALAEARHWSSTSPHWILLGPDGVERTDGTGSLDAEGLLKVLRREGFQPRWETRAAFLKEHPGHGDALEEGLEEALALAFQRLGALRAAGTLPNPPSDGSTGPRQVFRVNPGELGSTLADQVYGETAEALEALLPVEGWYQSSGISTLAMAFRNQGAGQSPRMAALVPRLREAALEVLQREPDEDALWELLPVLDVDVPATLTTLRPVPGMIWPPDAALESARSVLRLRGDGPGLLALADRLGQIPQPPPTSADAWQEQCLRQATLEAMRAEGLGKQGRWPEVQATVAAVRQWTGPRWVREGRRLLRSNLPELRRDPLRRIFDPLLEAEPLDWPAMPPAPSRTRIVLLDQAGWDRLRATPQLAPWSAAELRWESQTGPGATALRQSLALPPDTTWVLLEGDQVAAMGPVLPSPQALADHVARIRPSRLASLERLVAEQPGHTAAWRALAEALEARMPQAQLEPRLAEASVVSGRPPEPSGAWKPDPELWARAAQQALPQAEARVRTWPGRVSAWRAWLGWSRLHPRKPSPLALTQDLAVYGDPASWCADLPAEVHQAVAKEFRATGRFEAMRAWFEAAWSGLDTAPRRPGRPLPGWMRNRLQEQEKAIVKPYLEVLALLKRDQEWKTVGDTWRAHVGS